MLFICQIKPESDEKSVSMGKLFQMLTTCSVKNEQCNWNVVCMVYRGDCGYC